MVDLLIPHCDIDATNGHGDTALHMASDSGYTLIIQKLITYGANIALRNVEDQDAIDLAKEDQTLQLLQAAKIEKLASNNCLKCFNLSACSADK
jgi:ankyrin repeat protein